MTIISPLSQSLFVNNHDNKAVSSVKNNTEREALKPVTLEANFLQTGSEDIQQQADDLFTRANDYSKLSDAYSSHAQAGLKAYTALELATKRDAVSQMMGVDLYA